MRLWRKNMNHCSEPCGRMKTRWPALGRFVLSWSCALFWIPSLLRSRHWQDVRVMRAWPRPHKFQSCWSFEVYSMYFKISPNPGTLSLLLTLGLGWFRYVWVPRLPWLASCSSAVGFGPQLWLRLCSLLGLQHLTALVSIQFDMQQFACAQPKH